MPSLKAFGRRWPIAGEDLFIPALIGLLVACIWGLPLSYIYFVHTWDTTCTGGGKLRLLYAGALTMVAFYIALMASIVHATTRGTTINYWPRRHLIPLLKAKCIFDAVRLCFTAWCIKVAYFEEITDCDALVVKGLRYTVYVSCVGNAVTIFAFPYMFSPLFDRLKVSKPKTRRKTLHRTNSFKEDVNTLARDYRRIVCKRWQAFKKFLKLNSHPGIHGADASVTDYIWRDHVEDISPSDFVAGLIVLQREQQKRWHKTLDEHFSAACKKDLLVSIEDSSSSSSEEEDESLNSKLRTPSTSDDETLPPIEPQPWMTAENALYYEKYAKASYGWPKYVMVHGLSGAWKLTKWLCSHRLQLPYPSRIISDGPCYLNTHSIQMITGLEVKDIVYVSFFHQWAEIPFYVGLDHEKKTIVVAIRGTTSFDDIVTDVDIFESEDNHITDVPNARVHEGMLKAAQCLMQKLTGLRNESHKDIEVECLPERPILDMARDQLRDQGVDPQEYRVVIAGHSLGASVGGVLAVLLQQEEQYKDLMCFAYGPVGGLVSLPLARYSERFTCSVVVQDDVVSRMNKANAYDLKIRLLKTIRDCDIPKHVLFANFWKQRMLRLLGVPCPDAKLAIRQNSRPSELPTWAGDAEAEHVVKAFQEKVDDTLSTLELKRNRFLPMSPPGCVFFIRVGNKCGEEHRDSACYQSMFIRGDSPLLQEVQLSKHMFSNHSLKHQKEALQYLAENNSKPLLPRSP